MVLLATPSEHSLVDKIPDIFVNSENEVENLKTESEKISPAFKIVQIPCKGSGMIATRKLYPGDIILAEKPVIIVPDAIFSDVEKCEDFLERNINKLNSEDRELMMTLTDCRERDETDYYDPNPYCGLFYTNAMHFEEDAALCPVMARANHSCRANSEFITRADLGMQRLIANYIIKPGEEITINYMAMGEEGSDVKDTRQAYLRRTYGFHCTCRACTLQDNELLEEEMLRESIKEFQAVGEDKLDVIDLETLITKIYQIGGKHSYILDLIDNLYQFATVGSLRRVEYAVQGFTLAVNLYGVGSKQSKEWKYQVDLQKSVNILVSSDESHCL